MNTQKDIEKEIEQLDALIDSLELIKSDLDLDNKIIDLKYKRRRLTEKRDYNF